MYKQDLVQKLFKTQSCSAHPEWHRHCRNLAIELINNDPDNFMDFQAVKETMFVGNAEYTFNEFKELKDNIDVQELTDCDIFSTNFQHPLWPTTGNTIHHRYHLYMFEKIAKKSPFKFNSILELGGGYGNMARLCYRCGFNGQYNIVDLPEFALLQKYYLDYHGVKANWEPNLEQEFDLFIATWSLSEIPLEDRIPYENLNCKYFLMAFGPEYAGIDNCKYFSRLCDSYKDHDFYLFKTPYLDNQFYCIGVHK